MIKIAFIVSRLIPSGPTNQLSYIVRGLDRNKFAPLLISLSDDESHQKMALSLFGGGVKIMNLKLSRVLGWFRAGSRIKRILQSENVEVIHSQGIRSDVIAAIYLGGYTRVATLRNYPYSDYKMAYGSVLGHLMSIVHLAALKRLEIPVACSYSVSKILKRKHGCIFHIIPNGVRTDIYKPKSLEYKRDVREKYNLPSGMKIHISVGSLIERKDPLFLIEVYKNLRNCCIIFVGGGALDSACFLSIGDNSNIRLFGTATTDVLVELLACADLFVSASKSEGLPNSVLEALASGLPCILSDIEPHAEILNGELKAGECFRLGDFASFNDALETVQFGCYETYSANARAIVEGRYSAQSMSQAYQNLYSHSKDTQV